MNVNSMMDIVTVVLCVLFVALGLLCLALEVFDSLDYKDEQK